MGKRKRKTGEEKMKRRLQNEEELRSLCGGHKDGVYSQTSDEQIVVVGPAQTYASTYPSDSFLRRWPSVKVFCTDTIEGGDSKTLSCVAPLGAAGHLTAHRTACTVKNPVALYVNDAKTEESWLQGLSHQYCIFLIFK